MTTAFQPKKLSIQSLGKFWTLPNALSLLRLVLVIPVFYLIVTDGSVSWTLFLIMVGIVTDWIDGRLARWSNAVSEWGKILDPVADKIASIAIVLALVLRETLPVWFLAVIVVRDLLIVAGGMYLAPRVKQVVMSMWWGKVAVTALAITIVLAILRADADVLLVAIWVTTALLLYSFGEYFVRFVQMARAVVRYERQVELRESERPSERRSSVDAE